MLVGATRKVFLAGSDGFCVSNERHHVEFSLTVRSLEREFRTPVRFAKFVGNQFEFRFIFETQQEAPER